MMGYSFFPDDRGALLSRLAHQTAAEQAETIYNAARDHGSTFTKMQGERGPVWMIILHDISAKGANQANAVRNWIQQANTAERIECPPL